MPPRRRNGSKKIPQVILRPVPAPSSSERKGKADPIDEEPEFDYDHDGGEAPEQTEMNLLAGTKPFKGIMICCTGVLDKVALFQRVIELGGAYSHDLTAATTHLIAEGPGSAKYNFAVKENLPIMSPRWISESHARYVSGEDFTLQETEAVYRLPCFENIIICVTGENRLEKRRQMAQLMNEQGALYSQNLEESVTHLLVGGEGQDMDDEDVMSDKVKAAIDLNAERQRQRDIARHHASKRRRLLEPEDELPQNIHIVWSEWFWDCLHSCGRWNESDYSIERPRPKLKAFEKVPAELSFAAATSSTLKPGPTPLNGENLESELAIVRRTSKSHATDLWRKMIQQRGQNPVVAHAPVREPSKTSTKGKERDISGSFPGSTTHHSSEPIAHDNQHQNDSNSYLARINNSRTSAFNSPHSLSDSTPGGNYDRSLPRPRPFDRVVSTGVVIKPGEGGGISGGPFSGIIFGALGEANEEDLKRVIREKGGAFLNGTPAEVFEKAHYVIVRLASAPHFLDISKTYRTALRTECWIEQCIFEERVIPAEEHVIFRPLSLKNPIPGLEGSSVHFSGLNNMEITFVKRFCGFIGLSRSELFSRKSTTHLVCPSRSGVKYEKALQWGIEVVDLDWVYRLVDGHICPFSDFPGDLETRPVVDATNDQLDGAISPLAPVQQEALKPATPEKPTQKETESLTPRQFEVPIVSVDETPNLDDRAEPLSFGQPNFDRFMIASPNDNKARLTLSPSSAIPKDAHSEKPRSRSAVASSQSPSPLKIPVPDVVRQHLAALLEAPNATDDGRNIVPPPRKKARPISRKPPGVEGPGSISRSASMTSTRSNDSSKIRVYGMHSDPNGDDFGATVEHETPRVKYRDPGQQAAKRRLMALLESDTDDMDGSHGSQEEEGEAIAIPGEEELTRVRRAIPTRRSTRMAGF